jgi:hypothetical protein
MRIPINLASQPFRRARASMVASIAAGALLLATLGLQITLVVSGRAQQADVRASMSQLNRRIRRAETDQTGLAAALNRPENAEVLERVVFLNTLLYRKGLSWTRIFSDIEKVLPYNVKVRQIHPTLNARNEVSLDMVVASESPDPEIQFLLALEKSPLFGEVRETTRVPPSQSEPLNLYRVMVRYAPQP